MTPSWLIRTVAYVMVVLAAMPPILIFGPVLESRLFPVLRIEAGNVAVRGKVLTFDIVGEKYRSCPMARMTFAWNLDGLRSVATVYDGTAVFDPRPVIYSGEAFRFGPITAVIPGAAATARSPALTATIYYRCHIAYELEHVFVIPLNKDQ